MEHHGYAVAGQLHIEFDAIHPKGQRAAEGGEGVFGLFGGSTPVGNDEGFGHKKHKKRKSRTSQP